MKEDDCWKLAVAIVGCDRGRKSGYLYCHMRDEEL